MQRTREEMIEAASRARAARSAKAKQQRKRGGVMVAARKQTGSGNQATATKPRRQMVKANAAGKPAGIRRATAGKHSMLQPIQADCDYPLAVFLAFTGLTAATVRKCQRLGLRVRRRGNKRFVSGEDWLTFNRQRDRDQGGDSPGDVEGGGQ